VLGKTFIRGVTFLLQVSVQFPGPCRGVLRELVPAPLGGEKMFVLIFRVKKIMLKFEHFSKCTPSTSFFRFLYTPLGPSMWLGSVAGSTPGRCIVE